MNKVNIRTQGFTLKNVVSHDQFEVFGEKFHITKSLESPGTYTATHEKTGFCIDVEMENIEETKLFAINFLEGHGEEKVKKVLNDYEKFIAEHDQALERNMHTD